jgi:hypothetical protein
VIISGDTSSRTMYTDSRAAGEGLFIRTLNSGVPIDHAFDVVDEPPQLSPQTCRGIRERHPTSPPKLLLEPVLEHLCDAHQIDVDVIGSVAVDVEITAERLTCDNAEQSCFFLGFADCRVARLLAVVDRPLRHDPPFARGRRHQGHLDALFANPIRNYRCLPV